MLSGYFYESEGVPRRRRTVIFDHGMGGGHRAYLREIAGLAGAGFRVFAYDHTGCWESEGDTTGGFCQSLSDLAAACRTLTESGCAEGEGLGVVGHSWGGYAALNIPALVSEVTRVVALAGFRSVGAVVQGLLRGPLALYRGAVLRGEAARHPDLVEMDAVSSLRHTEARVLIVHSEDDPLVSCRLSFDPMERALSRREGITFLRMQGRGHSPHHTADAVAYKDEFFKQLKLRLKAGGLADAEGHRAFLRGFDWHRMTEPDSEVFEKIVRHLDS